MPRNRIGSWCCGSKVAISFPDLVAEIARDRIREAKNSGAESLVTTCPRCIANLLPAAMEAGIEVYDVSALLEKATGLKT
jgi:Fe-S oxidoreductase